MASITAKPNIKVTNLAIKRNGNTFQATWKVPAAASSDSNNRRWTNIEVILSFNIWKNGQSVKLASYSYLLGRGYESKGVTLSPEQIARIYPSSAPLLVSCWATVKGVNSFGKGPGATASFQMKVPAKPSVEVAYDPETLEFNFTSETETSATSDAQRLDTIATVKRTGTGGEQVLANNMRTTLEVWEPTAISIPDGGALSSGEFIKVTADVRNRGYRGDSGVARKSIYIAHPNAPACGSPSLLFASPGDLSTASILVPITSYGQVEADKTIYPEKLILQRLMNSSAVTPEAAAQGTWSDVSEGSGSVTGLTDIYSQALSDPGKHTWYRIVAERDSWTGENAQPGIPVHADILSPPETSASVDAPVISLISSKQGGAVDVTVSWSGTVNGLELSWSQHADAWTSNEKPQIFDVTWATTGSTVVSIKGLETGKLYYFKARTYTEGASKVYSGYSTAYMVQPYDAPTQVTATVPSSIPVGDSLTVSWGYDSEATQVWADVLVDGEPYRAADSGHTITGSIQSAAIPGLTGTHGISIVVSTDGVTSISSDTYPVQVTSPPTLSLSSTTLTAQPLAVGITTSATNSNVLVTVTSNGSAGDNVSNPQPYGEVVYSGNPAIENGSITLPPGLDFRDGADYTIEINITDLDTGLTAVASSTFDVAWTHQAPAPVGSVTTSGLTATISVAAPDGAVETDVLDVYRLTPNGKYLVAYGRPFGDIIDSFAPFKSRRSDASLSYRVVCRTADGDTEFNDVEYTLLSDFLRLDFGDNHVELAYNLNLTDSYTKDFEPAVHADGSLGGYWSPYVEHMGGFSAAIVNVSSAGQREALAECANFTGPVFVRTPDGMAYPANVDISGIDSGASPITQVTIEAQEVGMVDQFEADDELDETV